MVVSYTANGNWRPTIPNQTCGHCGVTYTAHSKGQQFCTNECKGAARRTRTKQACEICGAGFDSTPGVERKTCSRKCGYALIRKRSAENRRKHCVVCQQEFVARQITIKTCSAACRSEHQGNLKRGVAQSAETVAKRSAAMKAVRADPVKNAEWNAAAQAALVRYRADPANAEKISKRSSEHMARLHQDPEFQARRDERSSRTMKANWEKHRDLYLEKAYERSAQDQANGTGIWSEDAIARKNAASKWIMKKSAEAMRLETDYNEVYATVQARLRAEMPYDGPQDGSEYMDYLQRLGTAVVSSPECREIADRFMSEAIPRFAKAWRERKVLA